MKTLALAFVIGSLVLVTSGCGDRESVQETERKLAELGEQNRVLSATLDEARSDASRLKSEAGAARLERDELARRIELARHQARSQQLAAIALVRRFRDSLDASTPGNPEKLADTRQREPDSFQAELARELEPVRLRYQSLADKNQALQGTIDIQRKTLATLQRQLTSPPGAGLSDLPAVPPTQPDWPARP